MNPSTSVLLKTLIKPFYRQNAGLFIFLIVVMFGIVGQIDDHDMIDYHYALILGMLKNPLIFILVFLLWFIYAIKCIQFVTRSIQKAENSFLGILTSLEARRTYLQFFLLQLLLFLPVLLYSLVIIAVAFYNKWYVEGIIVFIYNMLICALSARLYTYKLKNHEQSFTTFLDRVPYFGIRSKLSGVILIRYLFNKRKVLLFSLKLYNCGILYLILRNLSNENYDIRLPFIFYSFGLLGHGILIYLIREFEEKKLLYIRSLPLSLVNRFIQYTLLYGLILIPEVTTLGLLTPKFLHYNDAFMMVSCSYSILLLLNCILFIAPYSMRDYLKMSLGIFFILYFSIFTQTLIWLPPAFLISSILLFFSRYYKYEHG
jgi:hypothetical protein